MGKTKHLFFTLPPSQPNLTIQEKEGQWNIKGRSVKEIPPSTGEKEYMICREFKSNDKISNKSAFYYLDVLAILNNVSDNTCFPEKNHFSSRMQEKLLKFLLILHIKASM